MEKERGGIKEGEKREGAKREEKVGKESECERTGWKGVRKGERKLKEREGKTHGERKLMEQGGKGEENEKD